MAVLDLERELQLRAAELAVADCSHEQLKQALSFAWRSLLMERQRTEFVLSESTGMSVRVSGELLPSTLRSAVG